jgi:hypothetical protein
VLVLKSMLWKRCGLVGILAVLLLLPAAAAAQTCTSLFSSSPSSVQVISPAGGTWSQIFAFNTTCAWSVTTDVPWITFTSATSGTAYPRQTVFVTAKVAPNNGPIPLHATVTLTEGSLLQEFPIVVISNSCSYNVDPPSAQFGAQGGSGQFTVTATPSDCLPFDPNSLYSTQLTASSSARYDHGIFFYGIPPNSGPALSATATLSSQPSVTFTVTQDGGDGQFRAGCPFINVARVGATLPAQCVAVGGTQPYSWSLIGGSYPAGITAYTFPGFPFTGTLTTEGPFSFELTATDSSSPPQTAKVAVSGVVQPAIVSINCSTITGPQQTGAFYFAGCEAKGGTGSYQWSIRTGALPNGLTISPGPAGGVIVSGTPTDSTPYYYVLQAADSSQPMPLTAAVIFTGTPTSTVPNLSMNCSAQGGLNINLNVAFSLSCTPTGGLGPYQYSISSGSLPPGLTTSGNSGTSLYISGAPNTAGEFKFTVQVTDSATSPQVFQQELDIVVSAALTLTCALPDGPVRVGQPYTNHCTASGGQPPYTISTNGYSLPPGLSFAQNDSNTGTLSGTPTTQTGFVFAVSVTDSSLKYTSFLFMGTIDSNTAPLSLRISCNPATLPTLEVGVPIPPVQCTVSGGTPPYSWPISNGLLGLSLTITGNTALLSGAPTTTGNFEGLYVSDSSTPQQQGASWRGGAYVAPRLSLTCNPASSPTSVGQVFSSYCSTSGGVGPVAWTTSGNLPPGLLYSSSTPGLAYAAVRGSPTTPGPYAFTITLQDSASSPVSVSQTFSGTILAVGTGLFLECSSSSGSYIGGVAITPLTCKVSGGNPPYQWSIPSGSLPLGLSLASVTAGAAVEGTPTVAGNYTYSLAASDSYGQTATWPVSMSIANPYAPTGLDPAVLSHLPFGDGWQSRIVLASLYSADTASLRFYGDSGNPIGVPYQQVGAASGSIASFIDQKMPPNAVVFLDTVTDATAPLTVGSAQLFDLNRAITGFGAFRYPSRNWEALVPLDATREKSYIVAFDNTGSAWTGVALASSSSEPVKLSATVRDESGSVLETASIPMEVNGHASITLSQQFPSTSGKRGTVQFTADSFGSFHALAVRGNGPALTTLPVIPASGYGSSGGSLAHIAYFGGYVSTFAIVNTGASATSFTLKFFDAAGGPLNVPLVVPQAGGAITTSALTLPLAAGAAMFVDTQANDSLPVLSGSAQLTSFGVVSGFEIFRWTTYGQEASVPFQTTDSYGRRLVFDNTAKFTTGVAVSNPLNSPVDVTVNIRDEGGNLLQSSTISLAANGHTAFMLPDAYPVTAGIRGSVEFLSSYLPPGVIGLRVGPNFTLTTIPAL